MSMITPTSRPYPTLIAECAITLSRLLRGSVRTKTPCQEAHGLLGLLGAPLHKEPWHPK